VLPPHDAPLSEKFSFWLSVLRDVQNRGEYHVACCPAHPDDKQSLSTSIGDKGIVATCHAGCSFPQICHAARVTATWMFERSNKPKLRITGTWNYCDELGEVIFRTIRTEDGTLKPDGKPKKDFIQQRPDGNGGWKNSVKGVRVIPYRLPDLWLSNDVVLIVEGEKHCDRLAELGFTATCNAAGAGKNKWKPEHSEFLRGRDVVILPDNDRAGRDHARNVAKSLIEHGANSVRVAILTGLPDKGDVIDFLNAGGTKDQIQQAIDAAKSVEKALPDENEEKPASVASIANHEVDWSGEEPKVLAKPMQDIIGSITSRTEGFPKRVGSALFVRDGEDSISWLQNSPSLFGWIGSVTGIPAVFRKAAHLHTQAEVFAEFQRTAESFLSVETLPHIPPIPDHYYVCPDIEPGNGKTLEALVDRYSPESEIDRDLLIAAFVTPFWGGTGGKRPIFVITSDAGRGAGKSTVAGHISRVAGGHIELSTNEDIGLVKQRLLSPEGMTKRIALIDNVKSLRFSSAELEALVTAQVISGKRMYVGEGQRPGTLMFILTVNGASFGRDISQRSVVIKITAPQRTGDWSAETEKFIDDNRQKIIADIAGFLQGERFALSRFTRWSDWERDVLCRLPEPDDAQRVILDRQQIADAEDDEIGLIQEEFASRLRSIGYFPDDDCVMIPSLIAAEWYNEITKDRGTTTSITRKLKQAIDEGTITQLTVNKTCKWGRGFIWIGPRGKVQDVQTDVKARIEESRKGKSDGF